ncbi:hypothetical protein CA13_59850 [Planctomycetes bacterium CA13]|uniref:3-oxo-tetronate kinase n=1 Tax=Novipirellula herctigrandis TaxID=2527986 RepID=A0A5C5ZBJ1_9BACT|nr:hypothetical protein CA13_59850 [Planctomycetes bacterium CA13]
MNRIVLGCIADDVTGATDLAINLVQGGMRVVQILGVPDADVLSQSDGSQSDGVDAIVVALKTRSIPKQDAIDQSLETLRAFQSHGIKRFYFKYCSTFDSTEQGNIGPVAESLIDALGVEQTVFCPAFPRAGRTVYQGHLFVADKLLSESGMQNHPLNPMTDANLVRFLAKQSTRKVGLLSHQTLAVESVDAIRDRLATLREQGESLVIVDTCDDSDLRMLARSVASMPLVTGGSGLARFLPDAYREVGVLNDSPFVPPLPAVDGRSLIVAGSCSIATRTQVKRMESQCPSWHVDVDALMENHESELTRVKSWAGKAWDETANNGAPLLVTSTSNPESVGEMQTRFGVEAVAKAIEQFLGTLTKMMVDELGVRRLILAGGETSGAVVSSLGIRSLQIGPEICAGVPWTETIGCQPRLALALKSGNFGDEDFFQTALEMLG